MSRLQQQGIRIPEDISVIGYDNIELAEYFSTIDLRFNLSCQVGKNAFEILLERIKDKDHEKRVFEMHLKLLSEAQS